MDFTRNQFSGLLNNVSLEKTRFINILHKLNTILNINKDSKLIQNSLDKLILTDSPKIIYENLNFSHPILKILLEYINKISKMGNTDKIFIELVKKLVDEITFLLDNGINPKQISHTLINIKDSINIKDNTSIKINVDQIDLFKNYFLSFINDENIVDLLIQSIKYTQSFDPEKIRIFKIQSGSFEDSYRTDGMIINRLPEGKIKKACNTSVGIFNCPFDINRTEMKGTILMKTSEELLSFNQDEIELCKKAVDNLNVNVVIFSGTVNDLFLDFADSRNLLILRIFNKYDLKRLCDLLGGKIYNNLGLIGSKGFVERIEVIEDSNIKFTKITNCCDININSKNITTIVLKNSIKELNDEMERKILKILETFSNTFLIDNTKNDNIDHVINNLFDKNDVISSKNDVVSSKIADLLKKFDFQEILAIHQKKCIKYAFEFISTILEIDDYLVAKADKLDVKPRNNSNWDNE